MNKQLNLLDFVPLKGLKCACHPLEDLSAAELI